MISGFWNNSKMNIKITYNWLLDFLDTDADPYELQKYLSLCGPSVESVEKIKDDFLLDVEVTSNRVDSASVLGIAQEAVAILPGFGKKAVLKNNPLKKNNFIGHWANLDNKINLEVDSNLCPRFTAITLANIKIGPSDKIIAQRLIAVGIRPINNVVDISNYIMVSMGQPSHFFDFDKIKEGKLNLRESRPGEKITTLDNKTYTLAGGDIVIEDGSGRLIDLCGIMGGKNTQITDLTKNILVFFQTYDGERIRKTSMNLGARSDATSYFEKGLDPERVIPSLNLCVDLLQKCASAKIDSTLIDIYPKKHTLNKIPITLKEIDRAIGVKIKIEEVETILKNLGFKLDISDKEIGITPPSWRSDDVTDTPDIVEEIARVYGYYNLPSTLPTQMAAPTPLKLAAFFAFESALKLFIKHAGFTETYTYSMISAQEGELADESLENYLKIANPISDELKYMRRNLAQSHIGLIKNNFGKKKTLKFFEIAKVYHKKNDGLPGEPNHLALSTNTDFWEIKGLVESIFYEFSIPSPIFKESHRVPGYLNSSHSLKIITSEGTAIGHIGKISDRVHEKLGLKTSVYLAEINLDQLFESRGQAREYKNPSRFALIKQDLNFKLPEGARYIDIIETIEKSANYLERVEFLNLYNNKITLRLYFRSSERNITEKEVLKEIENIKKKLNLPVASHSLISSGIKRGRE